MKFRRLAPTVVELAPVKRTISYYDQWTTESHYFYLQFPRLLFYNCPHPKLYDSSQLFVGFVREPVASYDDLVYLPPLGNIYNGGHVCCDRTNNIETAINRFWTFAFSADGATGRNALIQTFDPGLIVGDDSHSTFLRILASFQIWEQMSRGLNGEQLVVERMIGKNIYKWAVSDFLDNAPMLVWQRRNPRPELDFSAQYVSTSPIPAF